MTDDKSANATPPQTDLPKGLAETIEAFSAGCDAKNKRVAPDVSSRMVERFSSVYRANEPDWKPPVSEQVTHDCASRRTSGRAVRST